MQEALHLLTWTIFGWFGRVAFTSPAITIFPGLRNLKKIIQTFFEIYVLHMYMEYFFTYIFNNNMSYLFILHCIQTFIIRFF